VFGYICKVDVKRSGKTALQVASHQGYIDIVQLLFKAGASLQLQDEEGDTALHYSAFGYLQLFAKQYFTLSALMLLLCVRRTYSM